VILRGVRPMTRADLTEQLYQAVAMPRKESDVVVCAIFDSIVRALQSGDKVEIRGFGSFHMHQRRGRIGRNPKTAARVEVPAKNNHTGLLIATFRCAAPARCGAFADERAGSLRATKAGQSRNVPARKLYN
jgi:integration host factor subunit beta